MGHRQPTLHFFVQALRAALIFERTALRRMLLVRRFRRTYQPYPVMPMKVMETHAATLKITHADQWAANRLAARTPGVIRFSMRRLKNPTFLCSERNSTPTMNPKINVPIANNNEKVPVNNKPNNENHAAREISTMSSLYSCPITPILNKPGGANCGFSNQVETPWYINGARAGVRNAAV